MLLTHRLSAEAIIIGDKSARTNQSRSDRNTRRRSENIWVGCSELNENESPYRMKGHTPQTDSSLKLMACLGAIIARTLTTDWLKECQHSCPQTDILFH